MDARFRMAAQVIYEAQHHFAVKFLGLVTTSRSNVLYQACLSDPSSTTLFSLDTIENGAERLYYYGTPRASDQPTAGDPPTIIIEAGMDCLIGADAWPAFRGTLPAGPYPRGRALGTPILHLGALPGDQVRRMPS